MPTPFDLDPAARIAHGAGRLDGLGADVAGLVGAAEILLVADPGIVRLGLAERALAALKAGGHRVTLFAEFAGEPTAGQIDAGAEAARSAGATAVVGLGGGSALDIAKLVAAIARDGRPVETFALCAQPLPTRTLALIAVPTTAGTGAEVTRTCVFATGAGDKVWAWGAELRPDLALLDPTLATGLPPGLTAATGLDAMVHAIEATTNRRAHPMADAQALHAIALVTRHLPAALAHPDDLDARSGLAIAACLAGLAIDACGTAAAHALGHALGAVGHVPHGRAVALCLRAALPGNAAAAPARHATVARAMGLAGDDTLLAAALPGVFDGFLRGTGLAVALAGDGLSAEDRPRLTAAAMRAENQPMRDANCRTLDRDTVDALFHDILSAA